MLNRKSLKLTLAAASLMTLSAGAAFAGTETTTGKEAPVQAPVTSAITGDIGVNFVSQYLSRGLVLENQGVIAQPYADLYFALYSGDGFINKVSLNLSVWSSLNGHHPQAAGSTTAAWYEFDYTPGIAVTFAKNFTLTTSYFEFDSPDDSFESARSVNVNLAYNDTDLLGAFALHPHLTFLREIDGKAGSGIRRGNYYEVGVSPGLPAYGPVSITFPLTAGFGSNKFYANNDFFGYFSGGVNAAITLGFIPAQFGAWTANFGATYYYLHDTLAEQTAVQPADHNDFVFNGGVGLTF